MANFEAFRWSFHQAQTSYLVIVEAKFREIAQL